MSWHSAVVAVVVAVVATIVVATVVVKLVYKGLFTHPISELDFTIS